MHLNVSALLSSRTPQHNMINGNTAGTEGDGSKRIGGESRAVPAAVETERDQLFCLSPSLAFVGKRERLPARKRAIQHPAAARAHLLPLFSFLFTRNCLTISKKGQKKKTFFLLSHRYINITKNPPPPPPPSYNINPQSL